MKSQVNYNEGALTKIKNPKIKWLIEYVRNLSFQYISISGKSKDDFSQDRIKIFFHKKNLGHFLQGEDEKVIPITFEVWPSLTCDARCPLCTYSINYARKEADKSGKLIIADTKDYESVFEKLQQVGVKSLIFTGGGEPTLHPELGRLVNKANDCDLAWGIFTHGMRISDKLIHSLLSAKPRFIRLSINAGSPKGHKNEYRIGMETYQHVKEKAILASKISLEYSKSIGLGYALNGKISNEELCGISKFVSEVFYKSKGGLKFIALYPSHEHRLFALYTMC